MTWQDLLKPEEAERLQHIEAAIADLLRIRLQLNAEKARMRQRAIHRMDAAELRKRREADKRAMAEPLDLRGCV